MQGRSSVNIKTLTENLFSRIDPLTCPWSRFQFYPKPTSTFILGIFNEIYESSEFGCFSEFNVYGKRQLKFDLGQKGLISKLVMVNFRG